jgi:hypothetical protein
MSYVQNTFVGERARLLARRGTLSNRGVHANPWWPEEVCERIEKIVWVVYSLGESGEDLHEFTAYDVRGTILGVHRKEAY